MDPDAYRLARCIGLIVVSIALASCGVTRTRDSAPGGSVSIPDLPGNAVPRPEPRSRYGNGPIYEVLGKSYTVMESGTGYNERGVASWYGTKFHGRLTSNREAYDMYAMTAAHKTLPLPTFVRVRNLRNNKSIVVRVNDRGPFVHNRIIDLSYAAALKLDMVHDGTSLVEVTAITFDEPAGDRPTRTVIAAPSHQTRQSLPAHEQPPESEHQAAERQQQPVPDAPPRDGEHTTIFVQVGAFGSRKNAEGRLQMLGTRGISNSFIHADTSVSPTIYRVRIGPIAEVIQYDVLVEELENLGIMDPYLITD